jgi:hypothetical protein
MGLQDHEHRSIRRVAGFRVLRELHDVCQVHLERFGEPTRLQPSSDNWASILQNACAGDPARDVLGVYVQYKHRSPLGFFFNNL